MANPYSQFAGYNAPMAKGSTILGAQRISLPDGSSDLLVIEAPLVLEVAGGRIVTMRTPLGEQSDLDWAAGFLATEAVIDDVQGIKSLEWVGSDPSADPMPPIADSVVAKLRRGVLADGVAVLSRAHEMRASCGICGVDSPEALVKSLPMPNRAGDSLSLEAAAEYLNRMRSQQPLFCATGGCHGAAVYASTGELLSVAEDIGRHNAVDKAIGSCLRRGVEFPGAVLALSGRAGYELIVKALRVGIGTIVSVGAASSLSVALTGAAGARLLGFVREGGEGRVYTP